MLNLHEKSAAPNFEGSGGGATTDDPKINLPRECSTALILTEDELRAALATLSPRANCARRMVECVSQRPRLTRDVNRYAAASNLGHLKIKSNPHLKKAGFALKCQKPSSAVLNGYGEPSGAHWWFMTRVTP